jgi:hypothetical protein
MQTADIATTHDALSTHSRRAILGIVLVLGIALRLWGLGFGLPHDFTRPDEEKITGAAWGIFLGDLNPHFFLYPSLFIYLTAAGYLLLFAAERILGSTPSLSAFVASVAADPTTLHLIPRALAAVSGALTIPLLYVVARELFSSRAALAASALLAVVFLHVRDSHFGATDVPAALMSVAALWVAARCATRGMTLGRAAAGGLLAGLAASTKYNAALAVLPTLAVIAIDVLPLWRHSIVKALAAGGVAGLCLAAGFVAGTPFALLDRIAFLKDVDIQSRTALGLWPGSILDPARLVYGTRGWVHHFTVNLRYGLGEPLLIAGLLGALWLLLTEPRKAAVTLSFPLACYAAFAMDELAYARYMVPLTPFFCLTAGALVDRVAHQAEQLFTDRRVPAAVVLALVVLAATPTAARSVAFDRLVARTDTRVRGATWIEERFPSATMYQTGTVYGHLEPRPARSYPRFGFNERSGRFTVDDRAVARLPDLIVVLDSPLVVFNHAPAQLSAILEASYDLTATFAGLPATPATDTVYDQQDALYIPFAGFEGIKRPGPTVRIFTRRTVDP